MVLVFIENDNGTIKKSSYEAMAFASALAEQTGVEVLGVGSSLIADDELSKAGKVGVSKVLKMEGEGLESEVGQVYSAAIAQVASQQSADIVVMAHSSLGEAASSRLAIKLNGSAVTNVIGLPNTSEGFTVKRSIYTGKAFSNVSISSASKVLTVKKNSFEYTLGDGSANVEPVSVSIDEQDKAINITGVHKQEGDVLLPEADLVVSAGRGMKGPENWVMIEELAKLLGAATACSKPVSDVDWRPHHEHVGQTGIKISPNLYIAVGISGAIQHLAGVNSSKVIVVINIDPEAPFFKAADYGIVGDAFEVVPKLIEAFKNAG